MPPKGDWALSDAMTRTLKKQLSVVTELEQTDKPNRQRWQKEKLRLEKLLRVKLKPINPK